MSNYDWFVAISAFAALVVLLFWLSTEFKHGYRWVSKGEQKPYQDVAKAMLTAAGIALVIAVSGKIIVPQLWGYELRNAVVALVICLFFFSSIHAHPGSRLRECSRKRS